MNGGDRNGDLSISICRRWRLMSNSCLNKLGNSSIRLRTLGKCSVCSGRKRKQGKMINLQV